MTMDIAQWAKKAKQELKANAYMTIATSNHDKPWNSPVYCAYDKDYNFYWNSYIGTQHSKNIAVNRQVFVVVYNKIEDGFGVYMKGTARKLTSEKEITSAMKLLFKRQGKNYTDPKGFAVSPYKFTPRRFWINDEAYIKGKKIDIRIEITKKIRP
jgi:nitroimidazol reductase NimA-like FMN-containing flavoprotein (pyridoxamine 5'-phosphate oxidase superfamily)